MIFFSKVKWNLNRKNILKKFKKSIYSVKKKPTTSYFKINHFSSSFDYFFVSSLLKSIKILLKICFITYVLKFAFIYLRYYNREFKKDLTFAQFYGYARLTNYEVYMRAKSNIEFVKLPFDFHYAKLNDKNALNSFIRIFDKYLYHEKVGEEIGNFLLMLLTYEVKKPPKQDPINILLDEYIDTEIFMSRIFYLLNEWFNKKEFKADLVRRIIEPLFSKRTFDHFVNVLIHDFFILYDIPQVRQFKRELREYVKNPENCDHTLLNTTNPVYFKKVVKKLKKRKVYYMESKPQFTEKFDLSVCNNYFLSVAYDFLHEYNHRPIMDFNPDIDYMIEKMKLEEDIEEFLD